MDTYIDREGIKIELSNPIKSKGDALKEVFKVTVYYEKDECLIPENKGKEIFYTYPTKTQILWSIKQHNGNIAYVDKFYELEEQIPF